VAELSLVVLAAGMARRFGSLKQVAPVGPGDEALIDHTIHDAAEAGLDRVVVVVRNDIRGEVVEHLARRSSLPMTVVEQPGPGPGRTRPWGAAEAVSLALGACEGPVAVVNADDHYGADAMAALSGWLRSAACRAGRAALVTWPLAATTSPGGAVTRAVCELAPDGSTVTGLVEHAEVVVLADGTTTAEGVEVPADVPVSMNLWGFAPGLGRPLAEAVARFQDDHRHESDAELPLPTAVDGLVADRLLTVEALPAGTTWVGVTHPGDLDEARAAMAHLDPIPVR